MTEILLLEICTNIVINCHGIFVTFVAVAFPSAVYEMSYSLSCLKLCNQLSWAAFVSRE